MSPCCFLSESAASSLPAAAAAAKHPRPPAAVPRTRRPGKGSPAGAPKSVAREATVSMRVVRALLEAVEQAGVPRGTLLDVARLEPAQVEAVDARVPRGDVFRLCELALDLTGDPALGLHWGERLSERTFVPISHLIAHAASLRQALGSLEHFYRLLSDEPSYELLDSAGTVIIRCLPRPGESARIQRFLAEFMTLGFYRLIRCFSPHARLQSARFAYAAPVHHGEYARVFQHVVHFGAPHTEIAFDAELLSAPSPHQDPDVHEALQALAERRLLRMTQQTPFSVRVRELLVEQGWPERCDMATVAQALGLSVRSLRRRLAAEGKPYNEVVNEALALVAKHLLRDKQRTIQETAYEMGFSDTSTFHRAFKRWTGTTPSAYRAAQLARRQRE